MLLKPSSASATMRSSSADLPIPGSPVRNAVLTGGAVNGVTNQAISAACSSPRPKKPRFSMAARRSVRSIPASAERACCNRANTGDTSPARSMAATIDSMRVRSGAGSAMIASSAPPSNSPVPLSASSSCCVSGSGCATRRSCTAAASPPSLFSLPSTLRRSAVRISHWPLPSGLVSHTAASADATTAAVAGSARASALNASIGRKRPDSAAKRLPAAMAAAAAASSAIIAAPAVRTACGYRGAGDCQPPPQATAGSCH